MWSTKREKKERETHVQIGLKSGSKRVRKKVPLTDEQTTRRRDLQQRRRDGRTAEQIAKDFARDAPREQRRAKTRDRKQQASALLPHRVSQPPVALAPAPGPQLPAPGGAGALQPNQVPVGPRMAPVVLPPKPVRRGRPPKSQASSSSRLPKPANPPARATPAEPENPPERERSPVDPYRGYWDPSAWDEGPPEWE